MKIHRDYKDEIANFDELDVQVLDAAGAIVANNWRNYNDISEITVDIAAELKEYYKNFPGAIEEWDLILKREKSKNNFQKYSEDSFAWLDMKSRLYKSVIESVNNRINSAWESAEKIYDDEDE